jgi:hypothetical protein
MELARRVTGAQQMYGYTVEEVSRFLQYDPVAVRYWLRTGNLVGQIDPAINDWRVTANDLVTFLRQSSEPMPTGVVTRVIAQPLPVIEEVPAASVEPFMVSASLA